MSRHPAHSSLHDGKNYKWTSGSASLMQTANYHQQQAATCQASQIKPETLVRLDALAKYLLGI
jgi:hypothetical protein